jgi:hypothetical protein
MNSILDFVGWLAFAFPYLAIVAILLHNSLRRVLWRHGKNLRRLDLARCTTSAALGAMLMFAQVFYRPSMVHAVEAREQIDAEEDDSGDPEHPDALLHGQLKRIRGGETVGDLVMRM